jgi:hypothetical protein
MTGSVFKRCGCRGDDGRQLGRKCPRLARSGHGTWSYELTLPTPPGAKRRRIRENRFRTKDEAVVALEADGVDLAVEFLRDVKRLRVA